MNATIKIAPALFLVLAASACKDTLSVENLSNPDVGRVFASATSIEATIASSYQSAHNAVTANGQLMPELLVFSLESYSSLNNFNMAVRDAIPRTPISNSNGAPSTFSDYSNLARAARLTINAIDALDRLTAG